MKMRLLQDILKGLEALERQERSKVSSPKDKTNSTPFGKLINVTRDPIIKPRGPAGEPISSDPYAVDYPPQSYEYDPHGITFLGITVGSPEHDAKLNDFDIISKYDPSTAHKILTLS